MNPIDSYHTPPLPPIAAWAAMILLIFGIGGFLGLLWLKTGQNPPHDDEDSAFGRFFVHEGPFIAMAILLGVIYVGYLLAQEIWPTVAFDILIVSTLVLGVAIMLFIRFLKK